MTNLPASTKPRKSTSTRDDELAALIVEQSRDARARRVEAPRAYRGRAPASPPRLAADELVEAVRWQARRELAETLGRPITDDDVDLFARAATLDPKGRRRVTDRAALEREAAAARDAFLDAVARVRDVASRAGDGGTLARDLAALVEVLDPALEAAPFAFHRGVASLHPGTLRRAFLPTPAPIPPAPRSVLAKNAARPELCGKDGQQITTRALACVSILAGNWPPDVDAAEETTVDVVIRLEAVAMKAARARSRR